MFKGYEQSSSTFMESRSGLAYSFISPRPSDRRISQGDGWHGHWSICLYAYLGH